MKKQATAIASSLIMFGQVVLFALSVAIILSSSFRSEAFRLAFKSFFLLESALITLRAYHLGYFKRSPEDLHLALQSGGGRVLKSSFERLLFLTAVVALTVLAFT